MADQTVKITNLDEGSPARVAYEMAVRIWIAETDNARVSRSEFLDLYAECHYAARGYRDFKK